MNTKDKIQIMQAWLDGKKIQYRFCTADWKDEFGEPEWDWTRFEWRIKPEPREWNVTVFEDGHINSYGDNGKSIVIKVREVLE